MAEPSLRKADAHKWQACFLNRSLARSAALPLVPLACSSARASPSRPVVSVRPPVPPSVWASVRPAALACLWSFKPLRNPSFRYVTHRLSYIFGRGDRKRKQQGTHRIVLSAGVTNCDNADGTVEMKFAK